MSHGFLYFLKLKWKTWCVLNSTTILFLLDIQGLKKNRGKKPFKFETAWLLDNSCENFVKSTWTNSRGDIIIERLKIMLGTLRSWSGEKFTNYDLGKQAWRLITCPDFLFGRVMCKKYSPNGD